MPEIAVSNTLEAVEPLPIAIAIAITTQVNRKVNDDAANTQDIESNSNNNNNMKINADNTNIASAPTTTTAVASASCAQPSSSMGICTQISASHIYMLCIFFVVIIAAVVVGVVVTSNDDDNNSSNSAGSIESIPAPLPVEEYYIYVGESQCIGTTYHGFHPSIRTYFPISNTPDNCGAFCYRFNPVGEAAFRGFTWYSNEHNHPDSAFQWKGECRCLFDAGTDLYNVQSEYASDYYEDIYTCDYTLGKGSVTLFSEYEKGAYCYARTTSYSPGEQVDQAQEAPKNNNKWPYDPRQSDGEHCQIVVKGNTWWATTQATIVADDDDDNDEACTKKQSQALALSTNICLRQLVGNIECSECPSSCDYIGSGSTFPLHNGSFYSFNINKDDTGFDGIWFNLIHNTNSIYMSLYKGTFCTGLTCVTSRDGSGCGGMQERPLEDGPYILFIHGVDATATYNLDWAEGTNNYQYPFNSGCLDGSVSTLDKFDTTTTTTTSSTTPDSSAEISLLCVNTPNYADMYGGTCTDYELPGNEGWCGGYGNHGDEGLTPNENCCFCKTLLLNNSDAANPPPLSASYAISSNRVSEKADHEAVCKEEFSDEWSVADWDDLKVVLSADEGKQLMSNLGILPIPSDLNINDSLWYDGYFVTRNGSKYYSGGVRVYNFHYVSGGVPSWFLVHDQKGDLLLGSWYDMERYVLCKRTASLQ